MRTFVIFVIRRFVHKGVVSISICLKIEKIEEIYIEKKIELPGNLTINAANLNPLKSHFFFINEE